MVRYHRLVCVETVVGPLHHFSVEGCGQQHVDVDVIFLNDNNCWYNVWFMYTFEPPATISRLKLMLSPCTFCV